MCGTRHQRAGKLAPRLEYAPLDCSTEDLLKDDENSLAPQPVVLVLEREQSYEKIANGRGKVCETFISATYSRVERYIGHVAL